MLVAIIIFILTLSVAGGVFLYKKSLINKIKIIDTNLVKAKNSFDVELIERIKTLNRRIESSKKLLDAHTAVSPVFDLLENETLATIRFDSFTYELKDDGVPSIRLSGQGKYFTSVALQSDIFGNDKAFKNPIFSDLNPDLIGNIVFKFSANIDPKVVSYKNVFTPKEKQNR